MGADPVAGLVGSDALVLQPLALLAARFGEPLALGNASCRLPLPMAAPLLGRGVYTSCKSNMPTAAANLLSTHCSLHLTEQEGEPQQTAQLRAG